MLSLKNSICLMAVSGLMSVSTMAHATDVGTMVNEYYAKNGYVEANGAAVSGSANTISNADSLTFTGRTRLLSDDSTLPSNMTFSAPKINMNSEILVKNNGYNSITFSNAVVNFDNATWNATNNGPIAFTGTSGIEVTSNSPSPLIGSSKVSSSGDVNLVVANGTVADGSTFNLTLTNPSADVSGLSVNTDNSLYNITNTGAGTYGVAQKSEGEIAAKGYTDSQAALLKSMLSISGNSLFDSIASLVQMGQKADALNALDGLRPATTAGNQAAFDATLSTIRAIANHIVPVYDAEILAGMRERNHITPWIEGMYTHSRNDMKHQGFQMHQHGVAMGLDTFLSKRVLMGIGYSQTGGRFEADVGGRTKLEGYTGFVYGTWKPSQFFVTFMANYSKMKYDNKGTNWNSHVYGTQGNIGYEWGWIDVFTGARYIRVDNEKYTNAYGADVDAKDANLVTGVVGVHMQKAFKEEHGWRLVPSGHANLTYDIREADNKAAISYNGQHLYTYVGENQKRWGAELGASLKLTNGPAEATVSYEGAFREKSFSNGGFVTLKYHF